MKLRLMMAVLALGLCADALAVEKREFPLVSFVGPGGSSNPVSRDKFVILVVEGPYISFDQNPILTGGVAEYVNSLLREKGAEYLGVYIREGIKYGEVVRAIDVLRQTNARSIGVSMVQIPVGRDP